MIEIFGLVLAVLALGVGIWHVREIKTVMGTAKELTATLNTHAAALTNIQSTAQQYADTLPEIYASLTTRYIEEFEICLPAIIDLVDRASDEVVILCDFPAYCGYTNPVGFAKYQGSIERKIREEGKQVHLTCFNKQRRSDASKQQFADARSNWDIWKQKNTEQLKNFLSIADPKLVPPGEGDAYIDKLSWEQLLENLESYDDKVLTHSFSGITAKVNQVQEDIPLSFWLIDKKEAIFSIRGNPEGVGEYMFKTMDSKLISAFQDMLRLYDGKKD